MSFDFKKSLKRFITGNPLAEIAREYPIYLDSVPGKKVVIVATRAPKSPLSGGMAPAVKQSCGWADLKFWYAFGVIEPQGLINRVLSGAFNGAFNKAVKILASKVEGFRVRQIVASKQSWDAQYSEYCNRFVWPKCHNLSDFAKDLKKDDVGGNYSANETIAKRIVEDLGDDTTTPIWIHDYHHLPLASTLRQYGVKNPIVYFHHIPLPTLDTLNEGSQSEVLHFKEMAKSLLACDAVLFQTEEIVKRFYNIIGQPVPDKIPAYQGHNVPTKLNDAGNVFIGHAPISIDTAKLMDIARDPKLEEAYSQEIDDKLVAENILINFERCDYSKGILERVRAFEDLMEKRPDLHGKVQLLLGAEPTRGGIREFDDYAKAVQEITSRINARQELWAKGCEPVIFSNKNVKNADVIRLMRNRKEGQRRIGVVTPHEDGMNLTAKEFAAAQDIENAGPLVISSGAGTSKELDLNGKGAIVYQKVNGTEVGPLVNAIEQAIDMKQDEVNDRAKNMQAHLKQFDIQRWSRYFQTIFEKIQNRTFHPLPSIAARMSAPAPAP